MHTDALDPPRATGKLNGWRFFGLLALFGALDCVHDYVARVGEGVPADVSAEVFGGLLFWGPLLAMTPVVLWLARKWPLSFQRPGTVLLHFVCGLLFTYLHILVEALPVLPFQPNADLRQRFFFELKYDFALNYLFYCIIVGSAYLSRQYEDLKQNQLRALQLEAGLADTRLRAVQAQLNPHFFFNTLQAISVMALTGENDGVVQMLGRLSDLLRISFDRSRPQQIPLSEELSFMDSFLAIQHLSFGPRLTVEQGIDPQTEGALVPAMLLQPLVENAMVHGIAVKPGQGQVRITSHRVGSHLRLEVADSGPGFPSALPGRGGVGLSATESRLQLLYGPDQFVEYGKSDLGGASVIVRIPFRMATGVPTLATTGAAP